MKGKARRREGEEEGGLSVSLQSVGTAWLESPVIRHAIAQVLPGGQS
jgi:hypothetical protein